MIKTVILSSIDEDEGLVPCCNKFIAFIDNNGTDGYSELMPLIASAKVMGVDRLKVTWKYRDIYEKILSEIQ